MCADESGYHQHAPEAHRQYAPSVRLDQTMRTLRNACLHKAVLDLPGLRARLRPGRPMEDRPQPAATFFLDQPFAKSTDAHPPCDNHWWRRMPQSHPIEKARCAK